MEKNCVSLLLEKCAKAKQPKPSFEDEDTSLPGQFKCVCVFESCQTIGVGLKKKIAKNEAAKLMLEKLNQEKIFDIAPRIDTTATAMTKLFEFCSKTKKDKPLFSEKEMEAECFVFEGKFGDFISIGKAKSKKAAKENAAAQLVNHFEIDKFYEDYKKQKTILKNPFVTLHEECQKMKVKSRFHEEKTENGFIIHCTVGELLVKSVDSYSKSMAKYDAAEKMMCLLKEKNNFLNTPAPSPITTSTEDKKATPPSTSIQNPTLVAVLPSSPNTESSSQGVTSPNKRLFPRSFFSDDDDDDDDNQPVSKLKR